MDFEDFSSYLKTLSLPSAYQKAIDTLKPYGSVISNLTAVRLNA